MRNVGFLDCQKWLGHEGNQRQEFQISEFTQSQHQHLEKEVLEAEKNHQPNTFLPYKTSTY